MMRWDDEVDVLCIGMGGGVVAAGIVAARAELDVYVGVSTAPPIATCPDQPTVAFFEEFTEEFDIGESCASDELPVRVVDDLDPQPAGPRRRVHIEPFFGAELLPWARHCVASQSGVLYNRVTERQMVPLRSGSGERVEAAIVGAVPAGRDVNRPLLSRWLADEAQAEGVKLHPLAGLSRLVFEEDLLVGAVVNTQRGPWAVRAHHDVIIGTGASEVDPLIPEPAPGEAISPITVALVSKNASRFGRLELLTDVPTAKPSLVTGSPERHLSN
jgi:hypothetical protein